MGTVTVFVLISIAVLAVVASVVAVLPSKHQRLVGRMRSQAIQLGLKVQLISQAELKSLQLERGETELVWYSYWGPGPELKSGSSVGQNEDTFEIEDQEDPNEPEPQVQHDTVAIVFKSESDRLEALLDPQRYPDTKQLTTNQRALLEALSSTLGPCLVALKVTQNGVRCLWSESEQVSDVGWLAEQLRALVTDKHL